MLLGIPVYQGVNLLDVAGPLEMFYWAGAPKRQGGAGLDLQTVILSEDGESVTSHNHVCFEAQKSFAARPLPDVLWVPGAAGDTIDRMRKDAAYLQYLKRVAEQASWVCSVCEGALLLASAGLLDGYKATSHWAVLPCFAKYFPEVKVAPGNPRYCVDRNRLTGGGVSSGLDEALKLIMLMFPHEGQTAAQTVQLTTQYYPRPPVSAPITAATGCPF